VQAAVVRAAAVGAAVVVVGGDAAVVGIKMILGLLKGSASKEYLYKCDAIMKCIKKKRHVELPLRPHQRQHTINSLHLHLLPCIPPTAPATTA
jgi:hypothetical protein